MSKRRRGIIWDPVRWYSPGDIGPILLFAVVPSVVIILVWILS